MIEAVYSEEDMRYVFFTGDDRELKSLEKHLNQIPSYNFMPSFRGVPKPEVFLHKFIRGDRTIWWCHSGLWKECSDWCVANGVCLKGLRDDSLFKYRDFDVSKEDFSDWVKSLGLSLDPYDYQIEAAWLILKYRKSMSQLATRAGKTLIAYIVFRWMIERGEARSILMVVPSVSLVKQAVSDFSEYSEFFKSETVWGGGELCSSSNLTVGTFQSLVKKADKMSKKYDPRFFDKFDVVLIDECHTAKCKSIDTILGLDFMKRVKLHFGFSGSLPDKGTIESFKVQSLIGPMINNISAKELMDGGYITPIEITQIRVHYEWDDALRKCYIENGEYLNGIKRFEDGKVVKLENGRSCFLRVDDKSLPFSVESLRAKMMRGEVSVDDYISYLIDLCKSNGSNLLLLEQMVMFEQKKRLDVILELLRGMSKNCIMFAHHTAYLKFLFERVNAEFPERNVFMISGSTSVKHRKEIMDALLESNDCILVASYGCVGTGLTLKNIDYGIMAQSFKSQIINKQSLGRGMCLANDKDKYRVYDIIDCLPTKRLMFQGIAKERLYKREKFDFKIVDR